MFILPISNIKFLKKRNYTIISNRLFTTTIVNSILKKISSNALVHRLGAVYLCIQKLIDVQQALIRDPNPLKRNHFLISGKTNKNPISVNFVFFNLDPLKNKYPNENLL